METSEGPWDQLNETSYIFRGLALMFRFSKHPRVFPDEQVMLTMAHVSPKGGPEISEGCDLYCISLSQGGERRDPGDYAYGGPE